MMVASKTEYYQLLSGVLKQGLRELGYSQEDLEEELFASDKQHVLDLYCSKGKNCCYKFYCPSFGMGYWNPRCSELGKVLTKVALERSSMVPCSPDCGAHGGNEYWRTGAFLLRVFDAAGYGTIRQDTAGYGRIRQDTAGYGRIRQDTAGYGRIHQDTAGYERIRRIRQDTAGYDRIRHDTAGYSRIRQDTAGSKISACSHYENNHFAFIQRSMVFHTVLAFLL